jgi:hypothetical protein
VYPPTAGRARLRSIDGAGDTGQQMTRGSLVTHLRSIDGAGGVGVASGDDRRRGNGGAAAAAGTPVQCRRG